MKTLPDFREPFGVLCRYLGHVEFRTLVTQSELLGSLMINQAKSEPKWAATRASLAYFHPAHLFSLL